MRRDGESWRDMVRRWMLRCPQCGKTWLVVLCLTLRIVAVRPLKDLAAFLVCVVHASHVCHWRSDCRFPIETRCIPLAFDKELEVIKLTSLSDVHPMLLSSGRGRKEAVKSV